MNEVTIGPCRLICGDCRDVLPTLGTFDALIADPPYSMAHVDGGGFAAASKFYRGGELKGIDSFDLESFAAALAGASDQVVLFHSRDQVREYANWIAKAFGHYDLHVWFKPNAIPFTCNTWKSDLEYIALGWRKKHHEPFEQEGKSKLWNQPIMVGRVHPAEKPVELMRKYVRVLTAEGGSVVDPFMGSGTTGVACIRLGRTFTGIELEEPRFDVACKRISDEWDRVKFLEPEPTPEPLAELFS